jgi:ribonuclease VapC
MVIDTSALIAILEREPDARSLAVALESDPMRLLSAAHFLEASIGAEVRAGAGGVRELDHLIETADIQVIEVDHRQALEARRAYAIYGKGRHAASLNFGDCFAYALAKVRGQALLFKGGDFSKTDITPVV